MKTHGGGSGPYRTPSRALKTPGRSSTPAPVLWTGLALIGMTLLFLAYRARAEWTPSAPDSVPTTTDFLLGELNTLRSLSLDEVRRSASPVGSPDAGWTSSGHAVGLPRNRPQRLPELNWPPVLAEEQSFREAHLDADAAPRWSSGSHAAALPRPPLPQPPPPAIPRVTGAPTLSVPQPIAATAPSALPAGESFAWASQAHSLVLPRAPRDEPLLPPPLPVPAPQPPTVRRPPGTPLTQDELALNFTRGDLSGPRLLLSFDGGSEASAASSILNTLEREGVRTTLFLTGEFIRNHPDLVLHAVAKGHEIGNHTEHHPHLTTWESNRRHETRPEVNRTVLLAELEGARQALLEVAGVDMVPFWRAPYGEVNREILGWAAEAGYLHIGWSQGLDSLDWVSDRSSRHYRSPQEFLSILADKARSEPHGLNGAITLMHLHSNRPAAEQFARHLGETIRWLRGAGYDLIPASELVGLTGVPGFAYRLPTSPATQG